MHKMMLTAMTLACALGLGACSDKTEVVVPAATPAAAPAAPAPGTVVEVAPAAPATDSATKPASQGGGDKL